MIHGWFTEPKPFLVGALTAKQVAPTLDSAVEKFAAQLLRTGNWHGTLSIRLKVAANGSLLESQVLANTLLALEREKGSVAQMN
ncbi:hypothetical protein, partial [Pseudomonas sp. FW300-N1A5]|uniref:hypothetical protein n=1 Tax=Pseudomonas sp. FW300-N1A5 TaxID=2070664 RepID=UPI000CC52D74